MSITFEHVYDDGVVPCVGGRARVEALVLQGHVADLQAGHEPGAAPATLQLLLPPPLLSLRRRWRRRRRRARRGGGGVQRRESA